jgi:hypothetical protein
MTSPPAARPGHRAGPRAYFDTSDTMSRVSFPHRAAHRTPFLYLLLVAVSLLAGPAAAPAAPPPPRAAAAAVPVAVSEWSIYKLFHNLDRTRVIHICILVMCLSLYIIIMRQRR